MAGAPDLVEPKRYRVTVRHSPIKCKSAVVQAIDEAAAFRRFREDHAPELGVVANATIVEEK